MAATSALHTAGAVTSAPAARLAQTAVVAKNGLTPRTGVVYAGNQTLLTATASTSPMQVSVAGLHFIGSKADAQGTYWGANDGAYLLTIAAAPGSGSRTDVVYIMQQDSNAGTTSPDASTAPLIAATSGALPAGAVRIGTVLVPAGVTKLTDVGVVVTTDCQWTAAAGAPIPVKNQTQRDALTGYVGMTCQRLDLKGLVETYDGTAWRGARQTYTPAWTADTTNPAVGTGGSITGSYTIDDAGEVEVTILLTLGTSGTSGGAGAYKLSLPVAADTAKEVSGRAIYSVNGGGSYVVFPSFSTASAVRLLTGAEPAKVWATTVPEIITASTTVKLRMRYTAA